MNSLFSITCGERWLKFLKKYFITHSNHNLVFHSALNSYFNIKLTAPTSISCIRAPRDLLTQIFTRISTKYPRLCKSLSIDRLNFRWNLTTNRLLSHVRLAREPLGPYIQQCLNPIRKIYTSLVTQSFIFYTSYVSVCKLILPQNVCVTPSSLISSLQRPKSVSTTCPCASSRIFSGFKSLW